MKKHERFSLSFKVSVEHFLDKVVEVLAFTSDTQMVF